MARAHVIKTSGPDDGNRIRTTSGGTVLENESLLVSGWSNELLFRSIYLCRDNATDCLLCV
jgi:hypothetical protein